MLDLRIVAKKQLHLSDIGRSEFFEYDGDIFQLDYNRLPIRFPSGDRMPMPENTPITRRLRLISVEFEEV